MAGQANFHFFESGLAVEDELTKYDESFSEPPTGRLIGKLPAVEKEGETDANAYETEGKKQSSSEFAGFSHFYLCPVKKCDYISGFRKTLDEHIATKHTAQTKANHARSCEHTYNTHIGGEQETVIDDMQAKSVSTQRLCHLCGKIYPGQDQLRKHLKRHEVATDQEDYTCHRCGETFLVQDALTKHSISVHHQGIDNTCRVCGKYFQSAASVDQHLRVTHGISEMCYICNLCDYTCVQMSRIKQHLLTHKEFHNLKPFKCKICDYAVARKYVFKKHALVVHGMASGYEAIVEHSRAIHKELKQYYSVGHNPLCVSTGIEPSFENADEDGDPVWTWE